MSVIGNIYSAIGISLLTWPAYHVSRIGLAITQLEALNIAENTDLNGMRAEVAQKLGNIKDIWPISKVRAFLFGTALTAAGEFLPILSSLTN